MSSTGVSHRIAYATEMGRTHAKNQDAGGVWTWEGRDNLPLSLAIVADGVSAGPTSERASRLAVEQLRLAIGDARTHAPPTMDDLIAALTGAAARSSQAIAQQSTVGPASDATTLVAAVCLGLEVGLVWAGDSRAYYLHGRQATPVTTDHSWAEGVVQAGVMSAEQAARDPRAHMITRWLGPQDSQPPAIDTVRFTLAPRDAVICCSDGLYAYFSPPSGSEDELTRLLLAPGPDLQGRLEQVVGLALRRGGHDDITGAVIQPIAR